MTWKRNTKGLRPWKIGTSGNPRGRPRQIGRLIGLRPREEFEELMVVLLRGTYLDMERIARSKTRPPLQSFIAQVLIADAKRGRIGNFLQLMDYLVGKPKYE